MPTQMQRLKAIAAEPNIKAALIMIRYGESSVMPEAYQWLFGSTAAKPLLFESFADHPNVKTYERYDGQFLRNGKRDFTTAAGAYQITNTTYRALVKQYGFSDFSPDTQDLMAVALILEKKAVSDIVAGNIELAIIKLRPIWASLPGATTGQPTMQLRSSIAAYMGAGGSIFAT